MSVASDKLDKVASDNRSISQGERLVRVETQMSELKEKVDNMDKKLDTLLDLRSKGAGILWLLAGAGAIAFEFVHSLFKHG